MIFARASRLVRWLRGRGGRAVSLAPWRNLRRVAPIARHFGAQRGKPVDRIYIETFLERWKDDVRGLTLEVASDAYARRFGGSRLERCEVVSIIPEPGVTIVGDLTSASLLAPQSFDCIILTQTLQFIYDTHAVMSTCHAALRPGGVLLATVPGIGQIERANELDDFWRFTSLSLSRLAGEFFPPWAITVQAYGNVLTAVSLLHGIAAEELSKEEIEHVDVEYEVIVALRAVKEH